MPAAEIRTRCEQRLQSWRDRRTWHRRRWTDQAIPTCDASHLMQRASEMLVGASPIEIERGTRRYPDFFQSLRVAAARRAKDVFAGEITLLGQTVNVADNVMWHRDPVSGYQWPRKFYADVRINVRDDVDVKFAWEVSRQQFQVDLAKGWRLSGDVECAARVRDLMLGWIEENPLYEGVHWTSALEVAMRVISWQWSLAMLADWDGWSQEDSDKLAMALADHGEYLAKHLSLYSSPYNHLIGEATGLLLVAEWLDSHPHSKSWAARGRAILAEHVESQFYKDGLSVEQATGYHFFTLGFLTQAMVVARGTGKPIDAVERCVRQSFLAAAQFCQPDGNWPSIGDVDSARSLPVWQSNGWNYQGICSLGTVLLNEPTLKHVAGSPGEELFWVLGCDGLRQFEELSSAEPATATVFPHAGYAVVRSDDARPADWLLFDAGPIAEGLHHDSTQSVAHGHADALGLVLIREGRPIFIDSGTPDYNGPRDWVNHFRSPAAHNTLEVEGLPLAHAAGRLAWSQVNYDCQLDACLASDVWLLRGRMQIGSHARIDRHILGLPHRGYWVADWVRLDRRRRIRWYWQMAATTETPELVQSPDAELLVSGPHGVLAAWSEGAELSAQILVATEGSAAAWHSPGYGRTIPGYTVQWEAEAESALVVTFVGDRQLPAQVKIGDLSCRCGAKEHEVGPAEFSEAAADVVWLVCDGVHGELYAAGKMSSAAWQKVDGVGDWPAHQRTVQLFATPTVTQETNA